MGFRTARCARPHHHPTSPPRGTRCTRPAVTLRRLLALAAVPFLSLACGGDDDSSSQSALVSATCQFYADCCRAEGKANDQSACEQFLGTFSRTSDQGKANQCLEALKTATCGPLPKVCDQANAGSGKPGDKCTSNSDCAFPDDALDAGCLYTNGTSGCFVEMPPVDGAACSFSGGTDFVRTACSSDLGYTCQTSGGSSTGTCKKIPGPGDACTSGTSCLGGRFCKNGVCPALPKVGDACTDGCGQLRCDTENKCVEGLADGSPCTGNECKGFCDTGTKKCVGGSGSLGVLCVTKN